MSDRKAPSEADVARFSKCAGFKISSRNQQQVATTLRDLRAGVMKMDELIAEDTVPAIIFDATWED